MWNKKAEGGDFSWGVLAKFILAIAILIIILLIIVWSSGYLDNYLGEEFRIWTKKGS